MNDPKKFQNLEGTSSGESKKPISETAQLGMRGGNKVAMVMPIEETHRITHPFIAFSQFLLSSPLFGSELQCSRDTSSGREIEIES